MPLREMQSLMLTLTGVDIFDLSCSVGISNVSSSAASFSSSVLT